MIRHTSTRRVIKYNRINKEDDYAYTMNVSKILALQFLKYELLSLVPVKNTRSILAGFDRNSLCVCVCVYASKHECRCMVKLTVQEFLAYLCSSS